MTGYKADSPAVGVQLPPRVGHEVTEDNLNAATSRIMMVGVLLGMVMVQTMRPLQCWPGSPNN